MVSRVMLLILLFTILQLYGCVVDAESSNGDIISLIRKVQERVDILAAGQEAMKRRLDRGESSCTPVQITINRSFTAKTVRRAKNHHIATFDYIGKEYAVSFDFVPSKLQTGWGSVIHITNKDSDCYTEGCRLPGIWFRRENDVSRICVGSDISGNGNYYYDHPEEAIAVGKKVSVRVQQDNFGGNYVFTISINGKVKWAVYNTKPKEFTDMKVYVSDPWFPLQEGVMTNLEVLSN